MDGLNNQSWFAGFDITDEQPIKMSLKEWIKLAKEAQATVFLAGHSYNRETSMFPIVY